MLLPNPYLLLRIGIFNSSIMSNRRALVRLVMVHFESVEWAARFKTGPL